VAWQPYEAARDEFLGSRDVFQRGPRGMRREQHDECAGHSVKADNYPTAVKFNTGHEAGTHHNCVHHRPAHYYRCRHAPIIPLRVELAGY
jgi:hypothetical protein